MTRHLPLWTFTALTLALTGAPVLSQEEPPPPPVPRENLSERKSSSSANGERHNNDGTFVTPNPVPDPDFGANGSLRIGGINQPSSTSGSSSGPARSPSLFDQIRDKMRKHEAKDSAVKIPSVRGKRLGALRFDENPSSTAFDIIARFEVVPSVNSAGDFTGYSTLSAAKQSALRRPTLAAILRDSEGRYHVLETGWSPADPTSEQLNSIPSITPAENPIGYTLVEWVNSERAPLDQAVTARRIRLGKHLHERYVDARDDDLRWQLLGQMQKVYTDLIRDALPFVRITPETILADETGLDGTLVQLTDAKEGHVNVRVLESSNVHGTRSLIDLSIPSPRSGYAVKTTMSEALHRSGVFRPYISLNATEVHGGRLRILRTLLHEEAHLQHAERSLELLEAWDEEGRSTSFENWLQQQTQDGRVSRIDALLAYEATHVGSEYLHANTELLAEVAGFSGTFHAAGTPNGELDRLNEMAEVWTVADSSVQELAMKQLQTYIEHMVGPVHRDAFNSAVEQNLQKSRSNGHADAAEFYRRLLQLSQVSR